MRENAVPPEDFVRLIRAVRLEFEESTLVLETSSSEQNQYETSFPLLPFSMLLGSVLALRSVEFNHLNIRDLRGDRLILNPPNKESSEVWLPPELMAALNLARNWMSRYRPNPALDDPLLVIPIRHGPRSNTVVRFDTMFLVQSMRKFYRKYFALLDPDGIPYLFATSKDDESNLIPFSLSFRGLRSAAVTEAARHERNPEAVMRFARHKYFDTTTKYYIHETHREWINNVALSLAPSAELFRISLENKVAKPKEEKVARAAQAAVPGGHCEQALAGDRSCQRASDCRLCPFFRIHISKREFFVKERQDALEEAQHLQSDLGLTRDAQNLREFAALNQAIVNRIDEYVSR
jgi:integrase